MSDPQDRANLKSLERAIKYARQRGALPVAAAGNDGIDLSAEDCLKLPAELPGVLAVGALDIDGVLTSYSDYGLRTIDLVAPAGNPLSDLVEDDRSTCKGSIVTYPGNSYSCGSGTSSAAPHVSGAAALIISQFGTLGPDGDMKMSPGAVEDILLGSAVDIGTAGEDLCYGFGRVDALRAVTGETSALRDPTVTACLRSPPPPPASSCPGPQITDFTGDAFLFGEAENLDIVSAAFSTGAGGDLQITLTIDELSVPPPPLDGTGGLWAVYFDFGGNRYIVEAHGSAVPETVMYTAGQFNGTEDGFDLLALNDSTSIPGEFNPGTNGTIVFNVPRSLIGNPTDGELLTNLTAGTYYTTVAGAGVITSPRVDAAPFGGVGADYTIGAVCIPPTP